MTRYRLDNSAKLCIGADKEFPELHTIRYNYQISAPNKKIFETLEETCENALRIINGENEL